MGDDVGMARRAISSVLTVLGYVLFMGSLIAIMTQWLNQKIRDFERGLTPIVRRNHILILGWTNRTPAIVEELMRAEGRVRRFLRRRRARNLQIVLLTEDVNLERTIELRRMLGKLRKNGTITFRSSTPLRLQHLERVDFLHASAIILPGAEFAYGSANDSDALIVKTLLSIAKTVDKSSHESLPLLVTEIFDARKVAMAQGNYRGDLERFWQAMSSSRDAWRRTYAIPDYPACSMRFFLTDMDILFLCVNLSRFRAHVSAI